MTKMKHTIAAQILILACSSAAHSGDVLDGQGLLKKSCGRCHAVKAEAKSPIGLAPNLWEKLRSYPADRLQFELAEGMGSRHPAMPQIQFTAEEIAAIQTYLAGNGR